MVDGPKWHRSVVEMRGQWWCDPVNRRKVRKIIGQVGGCLNRGM